MISYISEFAIAHILLMLGYWLTLRSERQFAKRRFFILGATVLALSIPLLRLPVLLPEAHPAAILLPAYGISVQPSTQVITPTGWIWYDVLPAIIYICVSGCLLLRFLLGWHQLIKIKSQGKRVDFQGRSLFLVPNLGGSFSFLDWIFIDESLEGRTRDFEIILQHEEGHVRMGHSYDLLFLELFQICFWWLPSAWYALREIRHIHEYQADAYTVQFHGIQKYTSTLINSTLQSNGLHLASSFDDSLIIKRIRTMKAKATRINYFKIGFLTVLSAMTIIIFACTEERVAELNPLASSAQDQQDIFTVVEEQPTFKGGMDAFYSYLMQEIRYPKEAREDKVEGVVHVQFVVERDGQISNVKTVEGIGAGCDKEAERVIKNAPAFVPGSQRGRTVRVRLQVPISFKLNHEAFNSDHTLQGNVIIGETTPREEELKLDVDYKDGAWSGTIYSHEGDPLPGTNVYIEGTHRGTVSDLDGTFSLKASATETITVSFVGYATLQLTSEYRSH